MYMYRVYGYVNYEIAIRHKKKTKKNTPNAVQQK